MTLLFFSDVSTGGFWTWPNFWIEVGLAFIGIAVSAFALCQAGKAKDAAEKAGKTVKKQSILLAIAETVKYCQQIRGNLNYEDSSARLMEIVGKVRNIIGLYGKDIETSNKKLLKDIEACVLTTQDVFNGLDRTTNKGTIFQKMRPVYNTLAGHLSELQGVFEKELIENSR